jgi:multiple sugar transport system substrate-binding protein
MRIQKNTTSGGPARLWAAVLTAAALCLALVGCGGDSGEDRDGDRAAKVDMSAELKKPASLTLWSWLPDIEDEVALFEKKYPNIKVKVVNAGQGADEYTKLRTALKAGRGAPDVAQIEFQYVPTFTITNDLLDLTPYGANDIKDDFVDWTWSQVAKDGKVHAIPWDTGPMGMLYRKDLFEQYDIEVPKTWEEFAAAARKLHEADPDRYLTNLPPNDIGNIIGLMWQAGSRPFGVPGKDTVAINLTDEGAQRVADYWSPLIQEGVVSADPDFTDQWYQGLAKGRYATWLTAAWGPVFLQGTAKQTSGKWRAAPLPQWSEGESVSGNWGGSTLAVTAKTKNPAAAAALAMFLNHDPESTRMFAEKQFLFPATKTLLEDPEFLGGTSEFYGGQKVNEVFAQISETVPTDFEWNPFHDFVSSTSDETVGRAMTRKEDLGAALQSWEDAVVKHAEQQGFTVESG